MKCFPCFKPEKKMPSRRTERGEVPPANTAVSARSGAPLEKSGKNRGGCSCHSLQSRTSHHLCHQMCNHLHEKANPPVIYRDLKSPNILLDEEYNPKLSDFGLAKLGPVGGKTHISTRVMGTYGYCAPEYIRTGQLTIKTDVYSFGVFLLELITGKRAVDSNRTANEQILVNWAKPMIRDRRYHELVDPLLRGEYPEKDLSQAVGVAAMCLQEEDTVRPYMSDAVVALGFLAEVPAGCEEKPSTVPQKKEAEDPSLTNSTKQDESTFDRQRVVAEAIEWGAMRQKQKAQTQGKATDSGCIIAPTEGNMV